MRLWNREKTEEKGESLCPREGGAPPQTRPRRRWKKRTVALLAAAALAVAGGGFGIWKLFFGTASAAVLTGETTYGTLDTTIEGTGTTVPAESVTYTAEANAEVLEVCVSAGDTVEEGDLLYVLDDSGVDETIEEYEDEIAEYQQQLSDYNEQLSDLYEAMEGLSVTASAAGHLSGVTVEAGDTVQVGDQLAVLSVDGSMKLTQYFSYAYEDEIYTGMTAVISIPDQMSSYTGTVTEIRKVERITTEGTRCFAVTVTIDNPGALTEGMTAGGYLSGASGSIYPAIEGTLEYADTITIRAEAAGEVTYANAEDYQKVSAGEVLFTIDGSNYDSQITELNSQIERLNERIASDEEKIADAEESRSNYEVYSELSGRVINVGIQEGETYENSRTAVMIYNLDTMSISVNIDELDIEYVSTGMSATIVRSGAESDETYTGTVTEVSLEASNSGGVATFPVTIEIESGGALSAGVSVSYYLSTGDSDALEEGVLAPVNAVQYTDEGTVLFVQADSRPDNAVDLEGVEVPDGFYAVLVETGSSNANYIRILSGVEEGTTVFLGYQQSAPSGGDSTSQSGGEGEFSFDMHGGGMPDFSGGMSGGGGGMPGGGGGGPMG